MSDVLHVHPGRIHVGQGVKHPGADHILNLVEINLTVPEHEIDADEIGHQFGDYPFNHSDDLIGRLYQFGFSPQFEIRSKIRI